MSEKVNLKSHAPPQVDGGSGFAYCVFMNTMTIPMLFLMTWPLLLWWCDVNSDFMVMMAIVWGVWCFFSGLLPAVLVSSFVMQNRRHQHVYGFMIALLSHCAQLWLFFLLFLRWLDLSVADGLWLGLFTVLMSLPTCLAIEVVNKRNAALLQRLSD